MNLRWSSWQFYLELHTDCIRTIQPRQIPDKQISHYVLISIKADREKVSMENANFTLVHIVMIIKFIRGRHNIHNLHDMSAR